MTTDDIINRLEFPPKGLEPTVIMMTAAQRMRLLQEQLRELLEKRSAK